MAMDIAGKYVDGFVLPVPRANIEAYRRMAELGARVWKDHGALQYVECIADDVQPGKVTSFPQSVQLKDDEVVVLSWIVHDSREARDRTNAAVMADPRLQDSMKPEAMPFDGMRMFWGGFSVLLAS
jgi:uncharacterized protein YbaA (DUF1428 family)